MKKLKQIVTVDLSDRRVRCLRCNKLVPNKRKVCMCGAVRIREAAIYHDVVGTLGDWQIERTR